jgi:hypothetical protein
MQIAIHGNKSIVDERADRAKRMIRIPSPRQPNQFGRRAAKSSPRLIERLRGSQTNLWIEDQAEILA